MHPLGEVTVNVERMETVDDGQGELEQLQVCDMSLPPEILLNLRTQTAEGIVCVHDHVNTSVDESTENRLTSCDPFYSNPPEQKHGGVVVDMEEGHLTLLLSENEENCVKELNAL